MTIIPWVNIVILTSLVVLLLLIRKMWQQFRERSIDPVLDDAGEVWDKVDSHADAAAGRARGVWGRAMAWLGTWRGKPRR